MAVTLHIDLKWTDLEDFIEHFESFVQSSDLQQRVRAPIGTIILSPPRIRGDQSPLDIERPKEGPYTLILRFTQRTSFHWALFWGTPKGEDFWAVVFATRYRRDRLRIQVTDLRDWGFTEPLKEWIYEHWDDGVIPRNSKSVPLPILPTEPPTPNNNGYGWDDLFDWWYRGGKLNPLYNTLNKLAAEIGLAGGTVHNNHSEYKAQYGEKGKPDNQSKFAGLFPMNIVHEE